MNTLPRLIAALAFGTVTTWAADPAASDAAKASADTPAADASATTSPAPARASTGSIEKIDINTADADTLQQLPGVDEQIAQAIIAARPFKSVDDLAKVEGFGEARLAILKEQLTVTSATASAETKTSEPQLEPTGRPSPDAPDADAKSPGAGDADAKASDAKPDPSPADAKKE